MLASLTASLTAKCLIYIEKLGHHLFLLKPDINYLQQYTRGLWWSNSAARL